MEGLFGKRWGPIEPTPVGVPLDEGGRPQVRLTSPLVKQ